MQGDIIHSKTVEALLNVEMSTERYLLDWPLFDIHDEVGKGVPHDEKYVHVFELTELTYFPLFLQGKTPQLAYSG